MFRTLSEIIDALPRLPTNDLVQAFCPRSPSNVYRAVTRGQSRRCRRRLRRFRSPRSTAGAATASAVYVSVSVPVYVACSCASVYVYARPPIA